MLFWWYGSHKSWCEYVYMVGFESLAFGIQTPEPLTCGIRTPKLWDLNP